MTKHQVPGHYKSKPVSTPHPSLARHEPSPQAPQTARSVNELLGSLRRSHAGPADLEARQAFARAAARTVHPSLNDVLHVPNTAPPRPRQGPRDAAAARGRRGLAGPPAPMSWLSSSRHAPDDVKSQNEERQRAMLLLQQPRQKDVGCLPPHSKPDERSLLHQVLKLLAQNWEWYVRDCQEYLGTLPVDLKRSLLGYIAVYGPPDGIGLSGLKVLFVNDTGLGNAIGNEELTHLDLSNTIGRALSIEQLTRLLAPQKQATLKSLESLAIAESSPESSTPANGKAVADDWESAERSEARIVAPILQKLPLHRFPALSHLSLSHPSPSASWPGLISCLSQIPTITHLSLAHWPIPSTQPKPPNFTISLSEPPPEAPIPINLGSPGMDHWLAERDNDAWAESARILHNFSKATYCLKWLDLTGCGDWVAALNGPSARPSVDLNGSWRTLETIVLKQPEPDAEAFSLAAQEISKEGLAFLPAFSSTSSRHKVVDTSAPAPGDSIAAESSDSKWHTRQLEQALKLVRRRRANAVNVGLVLKNMRAQAVARKGNTVPLEVVWDSLEGLTVLWDRWGEVAGVCE